MDHQNVVKCFQSGNNINAVNARMCLIDPFTDTHQRDSKILIDSNTDSLGWKISETDMNCIIPTAKLILKNYSKKQNAILHQVVMVEENLPKK